MVLWNEFEEVSKNTWINKANADLKGKVQAETLVYTVDSSIRIDPFITKDEITPSKPLITEGTKSGVKITGAHAREINRKALNMLSNGAEALYIVVSAEMEPADLFDQIFIDMVPVFLYVNGHRDKMEQKIGAYIHNYYSGKNIDITYLYPDSQDIVYLETGMSFTERMIKTKQFFVHHTESLHSGKLIIHCRLKSDFLAQIAELRAIRLLANKIWSSEDKCVCIITEIDGSTTEMSTINPLIICHYLLLSSHLGMSDICLSYSFADDNELSRLCLNIQHIFKEESRIGTISDPTAGSYLIESITSKLLDTVL